MYNYQGNPQLQYPSQISSAPPPPYNPTVVQYPTQPVSIPSVVPYIPVNQPQAYQQLQDDDIPRNEARQSKLFPTRRERAHHVTEIMDFEPVVVGPCLWVLIITGLFCCFILGIFALVFAALACFKEYSGRIGTAIRLAKAARVISVLSIIMGMVIITVNLLLEFTVPQDYSKYLWDGWHQGE
ncbi:hypothetical protein LOD99_14526 [Oopsacas minuta]|uniref:Uncharacterized protein n=1 Tax=Oopsacas minuta TaxID=111878 RepID=A0AAV7KFG0_9METZ|nr:hypothetical protein LOD99_14526 [Oopsacas minuta]